MDEQSSRDKFYLDRRDFLKYSLSAGVVVWAGTQAPGVIGEAEAANLFRVRRINPAVFPQSVASGDPQKNGIVLWTRIASLKRGNRVAWEIARDSTFRRPILRGTMRTNSTRDNTVKLQLSGRRELKPFTTYYYRFIYNGNASRTGRFKTLPAPNADVSKVRFGYISCQDYTNGYFTALPFLAEENIDYVIHLGDYIYETVDESSFQSGGPEGRQIDPAKIGRDTPGEADTLDDYRFLYKTYKADRNLQRLHERFAFIAIWDDHEFANDCFGSNAPDSAGKAPEEQGGQVVPKPDDPRRSASNRAWAEFLPIGTASLGASPGTGRVRYEPAVADPIEEISIYRSFAFGNLMELVLTDERLYRDGPPCGLDTQDRLLTAGCGTEGEEAPGRTMLGQPQLDYFLDKITKSRRTWKIWGNETMFMQFKVANTYVDALLDGTAPPATSPLGAGEGVYLNLDQWDGYQSERSEISQRISEANNGNGVENFVVITGDLHTFIAGYARQNYDEPSIPGQPPEDAIGVCFMGGSVTSSNIVEIATLGQGPNSQPVPGPGPEGGDAFTAQTQTANPHIAYLDSTTHGYNLVEVTPQKLTCTMKAVSTIRSPQATLRTLKVFDVPSRQIQINERA